MQSYCQHIDPVMNVFHSWTTHQRLHLTQRAETHDFFVIGPKRERLLRVHDLFTECAITGLRV